MVGYVQKGLQLKCSTVGKHYLRENSSTEGEKGVSGTAPAPYERKLQYFDHFRILEDKSFGPRKKRTLPAL